MNNQNLHGIHEWNVELTISGAISIQQSIKMNVEKGEHNPFITPVRIRNVKNGISCSLVAHAYDQEGANDAALYFVGQTLDVLSLRLNIPLYLSYDKPRFRHVSGNVLRIVKKYEWQEVFEKGRFYSLERGVFSRSISWYRKGLTSEDPIDRVIAFWSALESIASHYCRENKKTAKGIKNRIFDCFDQVWGGVDRWLIIPNKPEVIDKLHEHRNGFSHGYMRVDIETIRDVTEYLQLYQDLVYEFLIAWEQIGFEIEKTHAFGKEK